MQLTATQTLTVTGDETVVAQDETVTCTAEVMLRVTLWLLDTGAVEADGSIVSFDLDADPLSAANAEIVTVGGVVIPGGASLSEVEVEGGVVAFEVALATNPGALDEAPTGNVVPIEGAKIKYRIVEEDACFTWGTIPCYEIVARGTVTTTGGVATLEIDGSDVDESDDDWQV